MRAFLLIALAFTTGCLHTSSPHSVVVDAEPSFSPQLINAVTNALEHSPTFRKLKDHVPIAVASLYTNESASWVMVDLCGTAKNDDFIHRWATVEVQTNSGVILRDGENESNELGWYPEFLPFTPPVDVGFPVYQERILEIQRKIGTLKIQPRTGPWYSNDSFFGDTNFIAFYEHPVDYASNAVLFLKSTQSPEEAKVIVVYSLQRLPLQRYLEFESKLLDLAANGQISSNLLNTAVFPGSEWSAKIQQNFLDSNVTDLITKMEQCGEINLENKEYLKAIVSGKARSDIRELQELDYLPADHNHDLSAEPFSAQLVSAVTNALEHSPTVRELKHHAPKTEIYFDSERDGWVKVDIASISGDRNHFQRWATLEVQTNSGVILKGEEECGLEEAWFPEFLPSAPPISAEFPGYQEAVLKIQQRVGQWVCQQRLLNIAPSACQWYSAEDFFGDTNFIALYEHPVDCASNAVLFLKSAENSEKAKLIVVYSLQRLPLPQYLEFENELMDLAQNRQISSNLLNAAILPCSEWSTKIQRNSSNRKVKELISRMDKCDELSAENRASLKEIVSGKARADIQEFQQLGYLPAEHDED